MVHIKTDYLLTKAFFFQAEDGIRDLVRSRGLGDVYKRQGAIHVQSSRSLLLYLRPYRNHGASCCRRRAFCRSCLLYTSDAADERSSVDLGGRRIIKKKNHVDCDVLRTSVPKTKTTRTTQIITDEEKQKQ